MEEPQGRFPLLRMMVDNAVVLSAFYLALGLGVEEARKAFGWSWLESAEIALDALPARALEIAGILPVMRETYLEGHLSEFWIRCVFGVTTIAIIFGMAVLVGVMMWVVRWAFERKGRLGQT